MKPKKYYILIISILLFVRANAQTVSEVVAFADTEFEKGNYEIAAREYNRALFFGSENVDVISLQIGHCYSEMEEYALAAEFYDRAYKYSQNDSLKNESVVAKAFGMLVTNQYIKALEELLYFSENSSPEQKTQMHYLKGIAYYNTENDSLACAEFLQALDVFPSSDSLKQLITQEFTNVQRYPKRYNPNRAYIMSAFFPGSGQFSVGAVKEGFNSMLLITGLTIAAIQIVKHYTFLDAVLTLLPWIQRYYIGGMDKAKALAFNKIDKKRYESYLKIIEVATPPSY
jgi:tetratricopeptide (TPR) repeat protein